MKDVTTLIGEVHAAAAQPKHPVSRLHLRMGTHDAHYAGNLVDGARLLALFGDAATELLIMQDGDEGLFRAYDRVEFLAPVRAGDYVTVTAVITEIGRTSRKMVFVAEKTISAAPTTGAPSACNVVTPAVPVAYASGTCVVPAELQRRK